MCREYEQTIDGMQNDLESLKKENADLKEGLRKTGKSAISFGLRKPSSKFSQRVELNKANLNATLSLFLLSGLSPGELSTEEIGSPLSSGSKSLASKLSAYRDASTWLAEVCLLIT